MSKQEVTQNGVRDADREIRRVLADELPSIDFSFGDDDPPARVQWHHHRCLAAQQWRSR